MNEMVERVAIAIKEAQWGKRTEWEDCDEQFKEMKRKQAIAAIKAMREPTVEMNLAALKRLSECNVESPRGLYQSMIDKVLND